MLAFQPFLNYTMSTGMYLISMETGQLMLQSCWQSSMILYSKKGKTINLLILLKEPFLF